MRTYVFKVNSLHTLEQYKLNKKNEREYVTNDRQYITANIANFINRNSEIHVHPLDISIVNKKYDQVFTIVNYKELFADRRYTSIRDLINRAMKKNPVIMHTEHANIGNTKKRKKKLKTIIQKALAGVSASLVIGGVTHGISSLIKNENKCETIMEQDYRSTKIEYFMSESKYQEQNRPILLSASVIYNNNYSNKIETEEDNAVVITDPEEYTEHPENFIEFVRPSIEEEITALMEYFNVNTAKEVLDFMRIFINTMQGYDLTLTEEEMIDIFYDISLVPQEDKINFMKEAHNLTDEQVDEIGATYIGEGGPYKYPEVFADGTTGLNHTQYQTWIDWVSTSRKMDVGDNIYLHTCYIPQFEAYKGKLYNEYLGNRDVPGYNAFLDIFYLFEHYHIVMHNYSEFRSAETTSFSNIQFTNNGNRFGHKMKPEDRLVSLNEGKTLELTKENSN